MANCNSKVIRQGVAFAKIARTSHGSPTVMNRVLTSLNNSLEANPYDAVVLMKLIEATFKLGDSINDPDILQEFRSVETAADIDAFVNMV